MCPEGLSHGGLHGCSVETAELDCLMLNLMLSLCRLPLADELASIFENECKDFTPTRSLENKQGWSKARRLIKFKRTGSPSRVPPQ